MRSKCNFSNNNNILHWRNRLSFTKIHSHNALISQMTVLRLRTVKWIPEGPQTGAVLWLPSYSSTSYIIADLKPQVPVQLQDAARQVQPSSRCWKDRPLKWPLRGRTVRSAQSSLGAAQRINPPIVAWEGSGGNLWKEERNWRYWTPISCQACSRPVSHCPLKTSSQHFGCGGGGGGGVTYPSENLPKAIDSLPQSYTILHTSIRESR